jgi:hypothetical protein
MVYEFKSEDGRVTCGYFCSTGCISKYQEQNENIKDFVRVKLSKKDCINIHKDSGDWNCEVCNKSLIRKNKP